MSSRLIPAPQRTEERIRVLAELDDDGAAVITVPRRRTGQPAIVSRLIAAIPSTAGGSVLEDAFTRVVAADSWGTPAPVGPTYTKLIEGGANQVYEVNGSEGIFSNANASARRYHIVAPVGVADLDAYVFSSNPSASAALRLQGITARVTTAAEASGEGYLLAYDGATVFLYSSGAGVGGFGSTFPNYTTIASVAKAIGTANINWRLVIAGSNLSGKVWTGVEPAAFDVTGVDVGFPDAGSVGAWWQVNAVIDTAPFDNFVVSSSVVSPIWDAYINDPDQLINIVDSSVTPTDRWIPQIVNGQRLNPGESLVIAPRAGRAGTQAVVTCSLVYA